MTPFVGICIVNYNGLRHLEYCLQAVFDIGYPEERFELILADNASRDESVAFVRDHFPAVRILLLEKNYGFAGANNRCAEAAKGEYILFLNNDTVVTRNAVRDLVRTMVSDKGIGVAGSKLLLLDHPKRIHSLGGRIVFCGLGYDIGYLGEDSGHGDAGGERGCVCAASFLVRRDEFLDFGGFDEDYFMYLEDVDLCWRFWLSGKKVVYVPESVVYHKFGGTTGKSLDTPLRRFAATRNALYNTFKNYQSVNVLISFFVFAGYNLLAILVHLWRFQFRQVFAILKGYASFFYHLPQVLRKRKMIQERRVVDDRFLFQNRLIDPLSNSIRELFRRSRRMKG